MIQRRTKPQVDPTATAPAFSHILQEFARLLPWADRAACKEEDPQLFFPLPMVRGKGAVAAKRERLAKAKAICARCPVRQECLQHAVELPEEYGIWGGLTEEERQTTPKSRDRAS